MGRLVDCPVPRAAPMVTSLPWTVVVPARAGSVGIPAKNLRHVGESTLIERAIRRALLITAQERVLVTTDDPVAAAYAHAYGCTVIDRPAELAGPQATIASTVDHALLVAWTRFPDVHDGPVAVCQPTSPTLTDDTVLAAIAEFLATPAWDSLALVTEDTHLSWMERPDGRLEPLYSARVNRQDRTDRVWRETGGLMLARSWHAGPDSLVTGRHHLYPVDAHEAIDIDSPLDLATADAVTRGGAVIEWRIVAGQSVGYGHLYRSLALAAEMPQHFHRWVVDGPDDARRILGDRYPAIPVGRAFETAPDVVVFDCLHIEAPDYDRARTDGSLVVGIELVTVPDHAMLDLYVDELGARIPRPVEEQSHRIRTGPSYASIRDEFRAARAALTTGHTPHAAPQSILVTFGGEDPGRFTEHVLDALPADRYTVRAVLGPGYAPDYVHDLRSTHGSRLVTVDPTGRTGPTMARLMLEAHVVVTSTGRTVWEAAYLGASTVTIPVNDRERDHAFPWNARRLPGYSGDASTIRLLVDYALTDPNDPEARLDRATESGIDGHGPRRFAWLLDGLLGGLA